MWSPCPTPTSRSFVWSKCFIDLAYTGPSLPRRGSTLADLSMATISCLRLSVDSSTTIDDLTTTIDDLTRSVVDSHRRPHPQRCRQPLALPSAATATTQLHPQRHRWPLPYILPIPVPSPMFPDPLSPDNNGNDDPPCLPALCRRCIPQSC